jgi:hypothetical protein
LPACDKTNDNTIENTVGKPSNMVASKRTLSWADIASGRRMSDRSLF